MCLVGNQGPWKVAMETTDIVHSFCGLGFSVMRSCHPLSQFEKHTVEASLSMLLAAVKGWYLAC